MTITAPDRRFTACAQGFVSHGTYDRDEAVKAAREMALMQDPGERAYVVGCFFAPNIADDVSMVVLCFERTAQGVREIESEIGRRVTPDEVAQ